MAFHTITYVSTVIFLTPTLCYTGCLTSHDAMSNNVPVVTLPLEHVRGRYTLGMYRQMGLNELIARTPREYISLSNRLLSDPDFHSEMTAKVEEGYTKELHKNHLVADEWLGFVRRLFTSP